MISIAKNKLPTTFEISIGGFMGPSYNLKIESEALIYTAYDSGYSDPKTSKINPSSRKWGNFWKKLDQLNVWGWQPDYENPGVMDGTGWSVDIEFGDRKIHSGGSNNYPGGEEDDPDLEEGSVFRRFLKAVQNLIGGFPFE